MLILTNAINITELDIDYFIEDDFTINSLNTDSYLQTIHKINNFPFNKIYMYYSGDLWYFSKLSTLNVSKIKIPFYLINKAFKNNVKDYVLIKIIENKIKTKTIRKNSIIIGKFLNYVYSNHYFDINNIPSSLIDSFLSSYDLSPTELRYKNCLKRFLFDV